jgi:hypothetical protein
VFATYHAELTRLTSEVRSLIEKDVAELNAAATKAGVAYIVTNE